ncbi:MAG: dihydroorotase, partial [Oscillospiraceae bacterium]|nr:dihydroorotase [Oscillospiraceae bacterium]
MTILLKGGRVVDSVTNRDEVCDVLIRDGVISKIGTDMNITDCEVIDCGGFIILPGVCDMHVHLRDPGQTHKEDLVSGTNAAAAGGVTSVVCMPNTSPVIDTPELVRDIIARAKTCKVKVHPCAAITKGLQGKEQTDFRALKRAGAVAVSDDGMPVMNSFLMSNAVINASNAVLRLISHSEDLSIRDTRESENIAIERDVGIAESTFFPIHIAHVSTKEAVEYIRNAKNYGAAVTCEAAPHHFTLTCEELDKRDADYRMNPPLREAADVEAVIEGLADGTID